MNDRSLGTDFTLESIADLPDTDQEEVIFARLNAIDDVLARGFAEAGLLAHHVKMHLLWKHHTDPETGEPCSSWTRWMTIAAPKSRSTMFEAVRRVEELLLAEMPPKDIAEIRTENFHVAAKLDKSARSDPDILYHLKNSPSEVLIEHVKETRPDLHIEQKVHKRFAWDESQAEEVEEAIALAERLHGAQSHSEAVWMLVMAGKEAWEQEAEMERIAKEMD